MLETIREYGLEQLKARREYDDRAGQHALYYGLLAEMAEPLLIGPEQTAWLARLSDEHDNFRAALVWSRDEMADPVAGLRLAAALGRFWQTRGYYTEGRAWLAEQLEHASDAPPTRRARALMAAGSLAWVQSDYEP